MWETRLTGIVWTKWTHTSSERVSREGDGTVIRVKYMEELTWWNDIMCMWHGVRGHWLSNNAERHCGESFEVGFRVVHRKEGSQTSLLTIIPSESRIIGSVRDFSNGENQLCTDPSKKWTISLVQTLIFEGLWILSLEVDPPQDVYRKLNLESQKRPLSFSPFDHRLLIHWWSRASLLSSISSERRSSIKLYTTRLEIAHLFLNWRLNVLRIPSI